MYNYRFVDFIKEKYNISGTKSLFLKAIKFIKDILIVILLVTALYISMGVLIYGLGFLISKIPIFNGADYEGLGALGLLILFIVASISIYLSELSSEYKKKRIEKEAEYLESVKKRLVASSEINKRDDIK